MLVQSSSVSDKQRWEELTPIFQSLTRTKRTKRDTQTQVFPAVQDVDFGPLLEQFWTCGNWLDSATVLQNTPCFEDDLAVALHDATGKDGQLVNSSTALFGICTGSDNSSQSALTELSAGIRRKNRARVEFLHPSAVLVSEKDDQEAVMVTFDLPQSPLLKLKPVLVLAFKKALTDEDLDVTFSSLSLQPHTQSACASEGTLYILLTGKSSEGNADQRWEISVQAKSPNMKQNLKDVLIGGKPGSMTPLLLFSVETGTNGRSGSSVAPLQATSRSFLCELRRFLDAVLPQHRSDTPLVRHDSLQSLPRLALDPSTSETLLAGIINSSASTVFSFHSWSSSIPARPGQLALSPALLEEVGQRLEKNEQQIRELIRQETVTQSVSEKLGRLRELSGFQRQDPAAEGESQYNGFLLLKALQMVTRTYNIQRRLRVTRSAPSTSQRICGLVSLTMSFEGFFLVPKEGDIGNCRGSCAFPMSNGNNHAVLLNSYIERGNVNERAPCCVPVAYDPMEVIDCNEEETFIIIKPDMVAKECGCR
ncbi:muellerian-inhibiting factor isoform X2 [Fundulus heteroclitus]|uniref:muellerian-inhibiting factor isoform X2 n=1 Tax=Fundulus heteroclitus TaxID=8078 RepID=UPI00165C1626|nr:muellerian-inhibiting factor isoform X2 [Fundulus heteroclitus]